jgi:manganese transport protein
LPSATTGSLPEIHRSVPTRQPSTFRRLFAFAGPAYLVCVGYMDPGNWATDLEGGARFGYELLWVLALSNLMALLLQTLSVRLGIVTQLDLAQACREAYPRAVSYLLWGLCEIAIVACDLAEVLGAAIALNLLFHIPLLLGVLLTAADTLMLLWLTRVGIRLIEAMVLALIALIATCFVIEIWWAQPNAASVALGFIPHLNDRSLYIAIGILGATVMPHNLYLHSALVQTRRIGASEKDRRAACFYNLIDSTIALNGAMLVNCAILALAASVFFTRGIVVTQIQQAHELLKPLLGSAAAGVIFAVALLCSGQSSTLTGTMAGQIVMEGFLQFRMRPWLRRLITRMAAIVPAALTIYFFGEHGTYELIILSQVVLGLQLPFAVIPLIHLTSSRERMGAFANKTWVKILAWSTAALMLTVNIRLIWEKLNEWMAQAGPWKILLAMTTLPLLAGLASLVIWVALEPLIPSWRRRFRRNPVALPEAVGAKRAIVLYRRILVPLDHTEGDRVAVAHAAFMARMHRAKLYLLHVEEDVTSQVYGPLSSTAEVEAGREYLKSIADALEAQGVEVETVVRFARHSPKGEIIDYARELAPDLIVMGAHGHNGLKDIVFGTTINAVRHRLKTPLLVVRTNPLEKFAD